MMNGVLFSSLHAFGFCFFPVAWELDCRHATYLPRIMNDAFLWCGLLLEDVLSLECLLYLARPLAMRS